MKKSRLLGALCACIMFFATSLTNASSLIADNFLRTGISETIIAPFRSSSGMTTTNLYHTGLVEVVVSGLGNSFKKYLNDAFYAINFPSIPIGTQPDPDFYHLNIGTNGSPFMGGGLNNIEDSILFINEVGYVSRSTLPAYDSAGHLYHFVIDTGLAGSIGDSLLTFGVSDGVGAYFRNGGEYLIELYEVSSIPIPLPLGNGQ